MAFSHPKVLESKWTVKYFCLILTLIAVSRTPRRVEVPAKCQQHLKRTGLSEAGFTSQWLIWH